MKWRTKREFAKWFSENWRGELEDQVRCGDIDDPRGFWYGMIGTYRSEGGLPDRAMDWSPPPWVTELRPFSDSEELEIEMLANSGLHGRSGPDGAARARELFNRHPKRYREISKPARANAQDDYRKMLGGE